MFSILSTIIVGIVAGWIANQIMGKNSSDVWTNLGIGLIGSVVGTLLAGLIGLGAHNMLGSILLSVIGACISIYVYDRWIRN